MRIMMVMMTLVLAFSVTSSSAWGQQLRDRRYQPPAGPTITPYLDYFRRDVGVLNNYYNYIVPNRVLTQTIRDQNAELNQLQQNVRQTQVQFQQQQRTGIRPTGKASHFRNYSHYYQFNNPFNRGNGRPPGRLP